jgi:hypothetical protein
MRIDKKSIWIVINLLFFQICLLVFLPSPLLAKPDLEIVILKNPNPEESTTTGMPIIIKIANKGTTASGRFKISAEHIQPSGRYVIQLGKQKGDNSWYVWYEKPILATTTIVEVSLYMKWSKPLKGLHDFVIKVDSCLGDEFLPPYCRVDESNENNNEYPFSDFLR